MTKDTEKLAAEAEDLACRVWLQLTVCEHSVVIPTQERWRLRDVYSKAYRRWLRRLDALRASAKEPKEGGF